MDVAGRRAESPKRQLDSLEEISAPKRQRRSYQRHHTLHHKAQQNASKEPALVESETVDKLLIEAIKDVCEEEGLKENLHNPLIESLALEAFRNAVEEYILNICSKIRRSMLAARRTAPIPSDFESAIHAVDAPRPDDQLLPYRSKPDVNPPLLPTPPPDDPFQDNVKLPLTFLGPELNGQNALKRFSMTTSSLPPLPSAHTYKDTAVFPHRETDTRKIRELATEEGKLGEQALRKLAGAVRLDAAHPLEHESRKEKEVPLAPLHGRRRRKPDLTEEAVFEDTMRELLKAEPEGFELGPIVTSEKGYRMPDDAQLKRRPISDMKGKASATEASGDVQARQKSSVGGPEVMEL